MVEKHAEKQSAWTKEWPEEPGWYWFFDGDDGAQLIKPLLIGQLSSGGWLYGCDLVDRSPDGYPNAWWHPMEQPPDPPGATE